MVELRDETRYHGKQSPNEDTQRLPIRACCLAPSAGGKHHFHPALDLEPSNVQGMLGNTIDAVRQSAWTRLGPQSTNTLKRRRG